METNKVLKKITDDYDKKVSANEKIKKLDAAAKTYMEKMKAAKKIAEQTGMTTEQVFIKNLLEVYPDGIIPEAELKTLVVGTLKHNYEYVAPVAAKAQAAANEALGVGMKPVVPKFDVDGAEKIAKDLSKLETVTDDGNLAKQIVNQSVKVVDKSIQANASAHYKAGFEVRVIRVYDDVGVHRRTEVCEWCLQREGEWMYDDAQAEGVFERHPGCGCEIYYKTNRGQWEMSDRDTWFHEVEAPTEETIYKRIHYEPKKKG